MGRKRDLDGGRSAKRLLYVLRTTLTGTHALLTGEIETDVGLLLDEHGARSRPVLTVSPLAGMDFHMKTTLEIEEGVMRELKRRAAEEGATMSELVEAALRSFLRPRAPAKRLPPFPTFDGGRQLVDLDTRSAWSDVLEDEDDARR